MFFEGGLRATISHYIKSSDQCCQLLVKMCQTHLKSSKNWVWYSSKPAVHSPNISIMSLALEGPALGNLATMLLIVIGATTCGGSPRRSGECPNLIGL
jgi:hypothetical protein